MLFGDDRDRLRRVFCDVQQKQKTGQPLEPLESIIAEVIAAHPEHHALLADPEAAVTREFTAEAGDTNPFLHMGMHIAIQEQLISERPSGIMDIYQLLCQRFGEPHRAEHQMMACLGETLWEAQRSGTDPDERLYLRRLQSLARGN